MCVSVKLYSLQCEGREGMGDFKGAFSPVDTGG